MPLRQDSPHWLALNSSSSTAAGSAARSSRTACAYTTAGKSELLGMAPPSPCGGGWEWSVSFGVPPHAREPLEQVAAIARPGRGFRVVLHREHRLILERNAAVRAVEQRDVGLHRVRRQRGAVDGKTVVH